MRGPSQRIRAGVRVRLTATVTATQIAIGGPVVEKMASLVNPRQTAPRMTVAADASRAGPIRAVDFAIASSGASPPAYSSRKRLIRNTQ